MAIVPTDIIKLLETIHRDFVWDKKRPNIKHLTLISDYSKGGLRDIDIHSEFKSLHLNWLNRLFDDNFHPWKQIPLFYFKRVSKDFHLFHPNLIVPNGLLINIPLFYRNLINFWQDISISPPSNVSMILSESLCFNCFIMIDNRPITPSFFGAVDQIYLAQLFNDIGDVIPWAEASLKFSLQNHFKWIQIVNAIPNEWKAAIKNSHVSLDICCFQQHLNWNDKMVPIGSFSSRFFYDIYIDKISIKPTSQKYFDRLFGPDLIWDKIYTLPHLATVDACTRIFQFKVSHNTLFLNSRLVHLGFSETPLCSLCKNFNETPIHFFCECLITVGLWSELTNFFIPSFNLDPLTPQSALFGFFNVNDKLHLIKNHILLLFKYCVYKNRKDTLNLQTLICYIKSTYEVEKSIYYDRVEKFQRKWSIVSPLLE